MNNDIKALENLNNKIGAAEDAGNRSWLENILAPELAFIRAKGNIFDNKQSLASKKLHQRIHQVLPV